MCDDVPVKLLVCNPATALELRAIGEKRQIMASHYCPEWKRVPWWRRVFLREKPVRLIYEIDVPE